MSLSTDSSSTFVRGGKIRPRLSQVYVDIPRSPLVTHLRQSIKQNHKENGFPKLSITSVKMSSGKRKNEDISVTSQKKPKLSDMGNVDLVKADAPCHQCRKRKPLRDILRCTRLTKNGSTCRASYCDVCLEKKYNLQLEVAKRKKLVQGHANEEYTFSCPRCDGHCSCSICLKKGAVDTSRQNVIPNNKSDSTVSTQANSNSQVNEINKSKPQRKKVIPPEPVWVPFLTECSRKEVEDRLYIREFTLRFNPILNIGVRALEELDDTNSLHDSSTKAILLALLDIITVEEETDVKKIQIKLKAIQGSGLNWSKIIHILKDLETFVLQEHPFHSLPIVEKQKDLSYNTRRGRTSLDADSLLPTLLHLINIVCNGGSIRQELEAGEEQAKKARSDYHAAAKNANDKWNEQKQVLIDAKPDIQTKGESKAHEWTTQYRDAEKRHKEKIRDLQSYSRVEINSCASRFEPLGVDMDGRIYYLPSSLGPFRGKKDRLPSDKERLGFRKWGWFIAVYGKPGTQIQDCEGEDSNNADVNVTLREEVWWGFADISEIRKLSKWLLNRAEREDEKVLSTSAEETSPAQSQFNRMKGLVKAINEFADFLDWRLQRNTSK